MPYKEIASSFLYYTRDNAISLPVQQGMVAGSGVTFREVTVEASHSPFLSKIEEVVQVITEAAESAQ